MTPTTLQCLMPFTTLVSINNHSISLLQILTALRRFTIINIHCSPQLYVARPSDELNQQLISDCVLNVQYIKTNSVSYS